jgi:uncharacterized protein YecE (DUF72 family)
MPMKKLFIGTSGYNYREWKGDFYTVGVKQKDWLHYYSGQFSTVEINATFYRNFLPHVFEKWYNETDPAFTFTLKGPRIITHIKRLQDIETELSIFFSANASLKEKLSCILWQFPASFKNYEKNFGNLASFLKNLPPSYKQVFEFRDASWFNGTVYELLNENNAGFVINDSNRFPSKTVITDSAAYVRFHGPQKLYASSYSEIELHDWSNQIKTWLAGRDVFCYFNNDMGGHAFRNARELRKMILGY